MNVQVHATGSMRFSTPKRFSKEMGCAFQDQLEPARGVAAEKFWKSPKNQLAMFLEQLFMRLQR